MAYILPQVLIFQDFTTSPIATIEPLRATVVGPHYDLKRYPDEKSEIALGQYDADEDQNYLWPGRPAGGVVDEDYTRLFVENAWQEYYENSGDFDVESADDLNVLTTDTAGLNLTDKPGYPRSVNFLERDVKVGDGIRVRDGSDDVWTYITALEADIVPSVVGTATESSANQVDTSASEVVTETTTAVATGLITLTADATLYDGLADGDVEETYTLEVVIGSTGGDATTARLRVESASGNDDVDLFQPAAFAATKDLTPRGLDVTFNLGTGTDLVVGQKWQIDVTGSYTNVTSVAAGGTYVGPSDTTYVLTVSKGGAYGTAEVMVSTTTGIDTSGPHVVSDGVPFSIGSYGVTYTINGGDGLFPGDRFLVEVDAEAKGAVRTMVLANSLPATMVGAPLVVNFFIRGDIEVTKNRTGFAPLVNFDQTETEFITKEAIVTYDASWTSGGVMQPLELKRGELYVHYRSLVPDLAERVWTFGDVASLNDFGEVVPDNPFLYGLFKAMSNSNGTEVKGISIKSNDFDGYSDALAELVGRDDTYGLVPLTWDREVQNLFAAHVDEMSSPENGRWRTCWLNSEGKQIKGIYVSVDDNEFDNVPGDPLLATISDDPSTSGTQYTKVFVEDGQFLTKEVQSGDILRVNYSSDGFGNETYESYVIDVVVSEDTLRLQTGPSSAITVASKIEIWRNLDRTETAQEYGFISGTFGQRRVRHVWPDFIGSAGTNVEGYFLCCALAGLRSGVAPHQGLTNVEIAGFDDVSRSLDFFNDFQLNTMAEAGTWIVTQDTDTGQVFTRHQLTSADSNDFNRSEDSITTNVDSISYYLLDLFAPFIGKANVTPGFLGFLEAKLNDALDVLKNRAFTVELGPQVVDYEITELREHSILKGRVVATVELTLPVPFNNFELHLVV